MPGGYHLNGRRYRAESLRSARGRKISSTRWLQRQLNDPFVKEARALGYRSRAVFKIMQIDQKYRIFKKGQRVMDLGSAPGGWSQLAASAVGHGNVFALDLVEMAPIEGVEFVRGDFLDQRIRANLEARMGKAKFNVVMNDMAPNLSGDQKTDHSRVIELLEQALDFAQEILMVGGTFIGKLLHGREEQRLVSEIKKHFEKVDYFKPESSRKDSSEIYVIAQRFRL
ncbi:MAG: RlmE family RNA methyltransferase [Rickettsiales bacterium]|jgi:23S rRNA (uridine2552-2'-O)-methyltransferase|nr:RlmE family RNA methyltransferase [Rickettsiales bacterium]